MQNRKIWLVGLLLMPLYGDISIGRMEVMVEKIKAKRVGASAGKNINFSSPFVMLQNNKGKAVLKSPKSSVVVFVLGGTINSKAFINKKWIKLGEKIEGYELIKIKDKSVILRREGRTVTVFLKKSKPILQLSEG